MPISRTTLVVNYAVAVAAVACISLLRAWLGQLGLMPRTPFVLFVLPTLIAGWQGGFGPGLVATFLSAGVINYYFLPPLYSFVATDSSEYVPLGLFLLQGVFISWMAGSKRRLIDELAQSRNLLEERVAERTAALDTAITGLQSQIGENEEIMAELNQSNRELQDFASVASHDLQEPLRKIQAFGSRLRSRSAAALNDEGRDYLDRMQNAAERMQVLINDLLTFSRVTTRAQPFEHIALSAVLSAVLSDLETRLEETGGRVEHAPLPTIDADGTQMRQLFQNLISNGLKFHQENVPPVIQVRSRAVRLERSANDVEDAVEITIQDNGIGFDEKYLDRIFNIFQRLHGRNTYEGTGIGLAVCRKIVERHRGTVTARSRPGEGAAFLVTLPVRQPETEKATYDSEFRR